MDYASQFGGYDNPYAPDLMEVQRKQMLAQQLAQAKPSGSKAGGIMALLAGLLAGRQQGQAGDMQKSIADRMQADRQGDVNNFTALMTAKPQQGAPGMTPLTPVDDEGNVNKVIPQQPSESPEAFQARRLELAKQLALSKNPQMAQYAMQQMMPQKKDYMKVKQDETILDPTRIGTDGKPTVIWGGTPKAPEGFRMKADGTLEVIPGYAEGKGQIASMDKLPKMGDLRTRISGGQEIQDEWNGKQWVQSGSGPRWQPQQPGQPQLVPDGKGGMAWVSPPTRGQTQQATLPTGGTVPDVNTRKGETDLRKEFEGLPEVKNYKLAYPAFASIKDAASRNTPQADINLVYGIAKIFDPTSVVREGEYATVANSPNIPDRLKGVIKYVQGGGKLTPEVKAKYVAEAEGRVKSYQAEVMKAKNSYGGMAQQYGYNPDNVFQGMGDLTGDRNTGWSAKRVN